MKPIAELASDIYREKVLRARAMPLAQKFLLGPELFDTARTWSIAGIRSQHPEFTDEQVNAEFRRRLEIGRKLANTSISLDDEA